MNAPAIAKYEQWVDRHVIDNDGHKVGIVADLYLDDASGYPEWLAVMTGIFGSRLSFVPINGASEDGDKIVVAYSKSLIKDSPNIDGDGVLSVEDEKRLYRHYGLRYDTDNASNTAASFDADDEVSIEVAQRRLRRRDEAGVEALDLNADDTELSSTNT